MHVVLLGVSFRSGTLEYREALSQRRERLDRRLRALRRLGLVDEWFVLATCNRFEVYMCSGRPLPSPEDFIRRFSLDTAIPAPEGLVAATYVRLDDGAVRHLMGVAAGLDSLVLGEVQILGQLRRAAAEGTAAGSMGSGLDRLVGSALRWARQVRQACGLGRFSVSMASAALAVARRLFGDLGGLSVAVVGSGKMGGLILNQFIRCGASRVAVVNRTLERAQELVAAVGGRAVSLDRLGEVLADADVVVSSTGASEPVIGVGAVETAMAVRRGRPLLVVDLAVPRDVETGVGELPAVYLYNVDDLQGLVDSGLEERTKAAEAAAAMLEGGVDEFGAWVRRRRAAPLLAQIEARVEATVDDEFRRVAGKLAPGGDGEPLRGSLRRVVRKVLHPWLVRIRTLAGAGDEESRRSLELLTEILGAPGEGSGQTSGAGSPGGGEGSEATHGS